MPGGAGGASGIGGIGGIGGIPGGASGLFVSSSVIFFSSTRQSATFPLMSST